MARPYCSELSTCMRLTYDCTATDASRVMLSLPSAPFFVVMMMTPFAAREPYIEAEAASFSTWIDSMSFGFNSCMPDLVGTPSMMYSGSLSLSVPIPRIRTVAVPEGLPSAEMFIPGTLPCRAFIGLFSCCFSKSLALTALTAPVKSALRWVV